jgi:tetratricopeptide (TPR) repeat protein
MTRALVFVLLLPAAFARAQAERSPASTDNPKLQKGWALYQDGVRAYNAEDYDRAIESFQKAYALSRVPSLLYNIAQAYRRKGAGFCGPARVHYQRYLGERPDAPDRKSIEERIDELRACQAAEEAARPAPVAPAVPPPAPAPTTVAPPVPARAAIPIEPAQPKPRSLRLVWIVGGAGVALAVAGAVLLEQVGARYDELERQCPCPRDRWQSWQNLETVSYGLLIAGGAAATTALVLWLRDPGTSARAWIAPTFAGIAAGGRF